MGALTSNVLTLVDWAKRTDESGKTQDIVEVLDQENAILGDMLWKEGNLVTGMRTTIRTGLPTVYWRLLNQPVATSKSTTAQVDEACGKLEAWSEVDVELAKLGGDINGFRFSESVPFLQAMYQEFVGTAFYGNSATAPEEFTGLSQRYSDLSAANAQNILDAGGTGSDNSSVWLIVWGDQQIHGIFPKGSTAGLSHVDHGEETKEGTSGLMRVYRDQYKWDCGMVVRDWRYAVRIANIDISNLVAKSSAADLQELMIKAIHRIPSLSVGRACFYMNRTCYQMFDIQVRDAVSAGGGITYDNVNGRPQMMFRGIPVKKVDQITETESQVT